MRELFLLIITASLMLGHSISVLANQDQQELAKEGTRLVKKYCYGCHGEKFNGNAQFNVLDRQSLLNEKLKYIVPENLNQSKMWLRLDGDMPPEDQP